MKSCAGGGAPNKDSNVVPSRSDKPCCCWRNTPLYLAPSGHGQGWGVYAGRRFAERDIVDFAPMFLRFPEERPKFLKETILNNYHYEYYAWDGVSHVMQNEISFGFSLMYNHSSINTNIAHQKLGQEPDVEYPGSSIAIGYYATRDIEVGEELLIDYGGPEWFRDRGLTLVESKEPRKTLDVNELGNYRSKVYSGYGRPTFERVVSHNNKEEDEASEEEVEPSEYDLSTYLPYLRPVDAGFSNVIAKERIEEGSVLEFVPALTVSKSLIHGTLLDILVVNWEDVGGCATSNVQIHFQPDTMKWEAPTTLVIPVDESALLPLAGSIGLMTRSTSEYNARIEIESDDCNEGSFCFRVTATKPIEADERIVVNLPTQDIHPLVEELALTGQPLLSALLDD